MLKNELKMIMNELSTGEELLIYTMDIVPIPYINQHDIFKPIIIEPMVLYIKKDSKQ